LRRREITLVALLAAVGGAAGGALLLMRDETKRSATPTQRPAAPDSVESRAASALETADPAAAAHPEDPAAPVHVRPDVDARRAVEPAPEVDFLGLVLIRNPPEGAPPEEGTLILRCVDAAAPPRRIEVAVKEGRFVGRGPLGAEVEVERLELSGRELATFEQRWPLSKRWIEIAATWAPARVLHVVDRATGLELDDVTVRFDAHLEGGTSIAVGFPFAAGATRSGSPGGHASPLRIFGDSSRLDFVVHAAEHGDERVRFDAWDKELTVALRPPASVRVKVEPWPVAATEGASEQRRGRPAVVVASAEFDGDESYGASRSRAEERWVERAPPSLRYAVRAALDRRALRRAAASTPLCHVAPIDAEGVARFDDLSEGSWVAWVDDVERASPCEVMLVDANSFRSVRRFEDTWRHDPSPFSADAGGRTEVVLRAEQRRRDASSVVVHGFDERTGTELELHAEDVRVIALDGSDPAEFGVVRVESGGDGDGAAKRADGATRATAGLAQVLVDLGSRPDYEPSETIVDLAPGSNEVRVALARVEGVVVEVVLDGAGKSEEGDGAPSVRDLRLIGGGQDLRCDLGWSSPNGRPTCLRHRFPPLPPGRYELLVPEDLGFDRSGTIPVEVRAGETTLVELHGPRSLRFIGRASSR
jgi:hypothetical protein